MPVSQFCWEEGKTWENGYYLLSAVAEVISSIMADLEMAKIIHIWKCENLLSLDMKSNSITLACQYVCMKYLIYPEVCW